MELFTDRESWPSASAEQIAKTIRDLRFEEFAILGSGDHEYIQTMLLDGGFLLERRDGSADKHYEAIPRDGRARVVQPKPWWAFWRTAKPLYLFTADEIIQAFCEYLAGSAAPAMAEWNKIRI